MGMQGKCVEILSCTEYPIYEEEVQGLWYKWLAARVPGEGTDFCSLEVIITVHFHSSPELGDFDKERKNCGGLQAEKNEGSV